MAKKLKIRAEDPADLEVVSACLQDAVVAYSDMQYLPEERRFVFVANRFLWEDAQEAHRQGRVYERVHCGVYFDSVTEVQHKGLGKKDPRRIFAILAVIAEGDSIEIHLSAGGVVRLKFEKLVCHLEDLDEAWPTQWRPSHPIDRDPKDGASAKGG